MTTTARSKKPARNLADAYRFFKEHAGYRVGHSAESAIALARAEKEGKRRGWSVEWEDDPEPWDADVPRPNYVFNALARTRSGKVIASLGSIGVDRSNDPYLRVVEAELFSEALSEVALPPGTRRA